MSKASEVFKACDREFIDLLDFEKFKVPEMVDTVNTNNFAFNLIKNLPSQIERFFELQRFDLDVTFSTADSPKHTIFDNMSDPDTVKRQNSGLDSLQRDIFEEERLNGMLFDSTEAEKLTA